MLSRVLEIWCGLHGPAVLGCLWMAVLLGALSFREGRIFLIPPFAATLTMLVISPVSQSLNPLSWCAVRSSAR
jgi:hypothetical protein